MQRHLKQIISASLLLLALCAAAFAASPIASPVFKVDRDLFKLYPSLMVYEKTKASFSEPETCAGCHQDKYGEWHGSLHTLALVDPVYQGEYNKSVKATHGEGPRLRRQQDTNYGLCKEGNCGQKTDEMICAINSLLRPWWEGLG